MLLVAIIAIHCFCLLSDSKSNSISNLNTQKQQDSLVLSLIVIAYIYNKHPRLFHNALCTDTV